MTIPIILHFHKYSDDFRKSSAYGKIYKRFQPIVSPENMPSKQHHPLRDEIT